MGLIPQIKDNVYGQLEAIVTTSSTNLVLQSGDGANFPQPLNGTATSGGTATTLNSTGIGASGIAVGDVILNLTDSTAISDAWSVAVVRTVTTNAITTTPLRGGSDNTWENSDAWCVNPIMVNLSTRTGGVITGAKTAFEKVLVTSRSTDTLTIPQTSGYRGKDGTTIQEFGAGSFVTIEVDQSPFLGLKKLVTSLLAEPDEVGQLVQTVGDQTIAGIKTFADDSARSATNAAPVDETSFANKKYVDDNSGGTLVWSDETPQNLTANTVYTFTHNLNVTQSDVEEGRYKFILTGQRSGAGYQFGDTYGSSFDWGGNSSSGYPRVRHDFYVGSPNDQSLCLWQANEVKIDIGSSGITNARVFIHKMW